MKAPRPPRAGSSGRRDLIPTEPRQEEPNLGPSRPPTLTTGGGPLPPSAPFRVPDLSMLEDSLDGPR